MVEIKNIVGIVAIILTFIGYIPYLRDVISGKTVPHIYSWLLWGLVTTIAFALQFVGNAGIGSFVTLTAASLCFVVLFLSLKKGANKEITVIDTIFLILAFIALAIWLFAKEPVLSTILLTLIDLLGFAPTIRKSWNKPYSETLSFYFLNTIRFALAVFSLHEYTVVTSLYPMTWILGNGLFAAMLLIRQKQLSK
ncbi:hypothetical protein BH09PAT2_BH09PAT2_07920 [soil metagenome]